MMNFFGQAFFLRKVAANKTRIAVLRLKPTSPQLARSLSGLQFHVSFLPSLLLLSSVSVCDFLDGVKEKEALKEVSRLTAAAEQLSMRGEGSVSFPGIQSTQRRNSEFRGIARTSEQMACRCE